LEMEEKTAIAMLPLRDGLRVGKMLKCVIE
jgi:hypothetical protein